MVTPSRGVVVVICLVTGLILQTIVGVVLSNPPTVYHVATSTPQGIHVMNPSRGQTSPFQDTIRDLPEAPTEVFEQLTEGSMIMALRRIKSTTLFNVIQGGFPHKIREQMSKDLTNDEWVALLFGLRVGVPIGNYIKRRPPHEID